MNRILRKYSLPGLKRWMFFVVIGLLVTVFGLALVLKAHPVTRLYNFTWSVLSYVADHVPPTVSGILAIVGGISLLLFAFFKANKQVLSLVAPDESSLFETLDREHMKNRGIKIACIGGGTGMSNMLKGLKAYSSNITAIVTVADDGGSSGRLRESMDIVPPGDIRNCIAALSHDDEVITQLFQYRFDNEAPEDLRNHSFGNLFLTALVELGGSKNMADAVAHACRILKARGTVLPVSNESMKLVAELEDGRVIEGESNIPDAGGKIKKLSAKKLVKVLPEVITAIKEADIILLGPGSLYTSIIPNLLVPELVAAIKESEANKIYVCNIMSQFGETNDYKASDHIKAIADNAGVSEAEINSLINYVIVNNSSPSSKLLQHYAADKQFLIENDFSEIRKLGIKIHPTNLIQKGTLVRHNPYKLTKAILQVYQSEVKHRNSEDSKAVGV